MTALTSPVQAWPTQDGSWLCRIPETGQVVSGRTKEEAEANARRRQTARAAA